MNTEIDWAKMSEPTYTSTEVPNVVYPNSTRILPLPQYTMNTEEYINWINIKK